MFTAVKVKVNSTDGHSNGDLARQHRVHTFDSQFLREVSQESCVKASFPYLQLSVFEGSLT